MVVHMQWCIFKDYECIAQPREGREAREQAGMHMRIFTVPRECGSNVSFPGGYQVDGLPPAPNRPIYASTNDS